MLYQFTGQYKIHKNTQLSIYDKLTKTHYTVNCDDVEIFTNILSYLTGTFPTEYIIQKLEIDVKTFEVIIEQLQNLSLINELSYAHRFLIVTDESIRSKHLENKLIASEKFDKNTFLSTSISNLEFINPPIEINLIISITSSVNNKDFFRKIEDYSIKNKLNLFIVTLQQQNFFVGPLLSSEDGPCITCLDYLLPSNTNELNESLGENTSTIADILSNELIRYLHDITYANSFNTLIHVDLINYSIMQQRLFKYPNCPGCKVKKEMVR